MHVPHHPPETPLSGVNNFILPHKFTKTKGTRKEMLRIKFYKMERRHNRKHTHTMTIHSSYLFLFFTVALRLD
jgi:hypothetical protein